MSVANNKYLFYLICIPVRIYLAYVVSVLSQNPAFTNYLPIFGVFFGVVALSWIYLFFFGQKTNMVGQQIWWNNQRPIHAFFYMAAAVLCFTRYQKYVWVPVLAEAIFGLGNGIYHIV